MRHLLLLAAMLIALAPVAHAASPTSLGQISVAQVIEMVDKSRSDGAAALTVAAYLAGLGEATGIMVGEAQKRGARPVSCTASFTLSDAVAVAALMAAAPDQAQWGETAATPIIIADLFGRAGCS